METNEETRGARARAKASGYGATGVAVTSMAVLAVAIFAGTRHARDGSITAPAPAAAPSEVAAAPSEVAAAPQASAEKHAPRRLESANRRELETTLPKAASVEITANDGDPEALRLAQEIHGFLLAKGYAAAAVTRSVSTPPAKGVGLEPLAGGKWRVIVGSADE